MSRVNLRGHLLLWRGRQTGVWLRPVPLLAVAGILVFTGGAVLTLLSWLPVIQDVNHGCEGHAFGCHAGIELLGTVATVGFAFASLAYWRVYRIANHYRRKAQEKPGQLVRAVASNDQRDNEVIGRDGLCRIIEEDLRSSSRPRVLVGGVGAGKTTVLVQLTKVLAQRGAVPVPIRLRDVNGDLDFLDLAKRRFLKQVNDRLISSEEGEKIWKKLRSDRRIVVLADGLDETLVDAPRRDAAIRLAISEAQAQEIPLVIASRPDDSLYGIDAAVIRLEQLEAEDVVNDLDGRTPTEDREAVASLAETAELSESPFYLSVARELLQHSRLPASGFDEGRLALRVKLLKEWTRCLISGKLERVDAYLLQDERSGSVEDLKRMACEAMRENKLELKFEKLREHPISARTGEEQEIDAESARAVAEVAEPLELVDTVGGGIRFQQSIMQSYLGAQYLPVLLRAKTKPRLRTLFKEGNPRTNGRLSTRTEGRFMDDALRDPGRELLIALAMSCCIEGDPRFCRAVREKLRKQVKTADRQVTAGTFDMLTAAFEVDGLLGGQGNRALCEAATDVWARQSSSSAAPGARRDLKVIGAKLRTIARMDDVPTEEAYRALWSICCTEGSYRVRLTAAQTIGAGGSTALAALRNETAKAWTCAPRLVSSHATTTATWKDVRQSSIQGWVLPMLATGCKPSDREEVAEMLRRWIGLAANDLHLGVETCLAQGFKYEANRRIDFGSGTEELIRLALCLLRSSRWWYSQLTLVQSLALWSLAPESPRDLLRQEIEQWVSADRHPFVRRAAALALKARPDSEDRPSRFIWIDEAGIAAKVGPETARPEAGLYIPDAAGWLSLTDRAKALVADILLFLNMIERGERGSGAEPDLQERDKRLRERELRRRRVRAQKAALPVCLSRATERSRLDVAGGTERSLKASDAAAERASDKDGQVRAECGCDFGLCPYPAKRECLFREELTETFCRGQRRLVERGKHAVPPRRALTKFWKSMETRAEEPMARVLDM